MDKYQEAYQEAMNLYKSGVRIDRINNVLIREYDEAVYERVMEELRGKEKEKRREKARHAMLIGFVSFALGLVITLGSYLSAHPGSIYFIETGLIVFGLFKFIVGFLVRK